MRAPGASPKPGPARPTGGPAVSTTAAARGNVIPFAPSRGAAAARKLDEDELEDDDATQIATAPSELRAPVLGGAANVGTAVVASAASVSAAPATVSVDDPFAAPLAAPPKGAEPAVAAAASSTANPIPSTPAPSTPFVPAHLAKSPSAPAGERSTMFEAARLHARGLSKGVVALIAAAALLVGVIVAVTLTKPRVEYRDRERVVEKQVEVPVSVFVPSAVDSAIPTADVVAAKGPAGAPAPKATAAATTTSTATTPSKKLGGLDLGPEGPAGPGSEGPKGTGQALDGKSVETVVASKRVGVRKQCYETWADKGGASVRLLLKIGPNGSVQSADIASSSGEPAIGQCVQRLARSWTFPPSEAGGTFAVPFLFGT
jgi:TonB family protein